MSTMLDAPHIDNCGIVQAAEEFDGGCWDRYGPERGDFLLPPLKTHEPILRVAELVLGARRWCVVPRCLGWSGHARESKWFEM